MPASQRLLPSVLVLDPDAPTRAHLAEILAGRFRVAAVASLAEAVDQIVWQRPMFLLIELDLPGDALAFIRQLHTDPATRGIIIACVTQRRDVQAKVAAFKAGADDYIVKPVNAQSLPFRLLLLPRIRTP